MTCGNDNGNAGTYLEKLCLDKELEYMGCASVIMPENYIAMFQVPSELESVQIVQNCESVVAQIVKDINEGRCLPKSKVSIRDRFKSGIINNVYYPLLVHAKNSISRYHCPK